MRFSDLWTFYKDSRGGVRWKRQAKNGKVVGASSESFANLRNCKENAQRNGWSSSSRSVFEGGLAE